MVTLLAKLFIKDSSQYLEPSVRRGYGLVCGALGIALNIVLFTVKIFAGTLASSVSISADAFNNLSDAGSSIITVLGFKLAAQKPDTSHPFGHGRIEYISGLIVAMIIAVMGVELLASSIEGIINPKEVKFSWLSMGVLGFSIVIKAYMAYYNRSIGKKADSVAMRATALDSLTDCITTLVAMGAMIASKLWNVNLDGWCGAAVSLFVLYSAINAAKDTINPLLGQAPEKRLVEGIEQTVMSYPDVLGIHDLIVHNYGPGRLMISLHAEVPANGDLIQLHDMIDNVERELSAKFSCSTVIHMDPVVRDDPFALTLKKRVTAIVLNIDKDITVHDFRIVAGPTHTNIIFDAALPYESRVTEKELKERISADVSKMDGGNFFAAVTVDRGYV